MDSLYVLAWSMSIVASRSINHLVCKDGMQPHIKKKHRHLLYVHAESLFYIYKYFHHIYEYFSFIYCLRDVNIWEQLNCIYWYLASDRLFIWRLIYVSRDCLNRTLKKTLLDVYNALCYSRGFALKAEWKHTMLLLPPIKAIYRVSS